MVSKSSSHEKWWLQPNDLTCIVGELYTDLRHADEGFVEVSDRAVRILRSFKPHIPNTPLRKESSIGDDVVL